MFNKTGVIVLTILLSLLSFYYLHFTFVSRSVYNEATSKATQGGKIDFRKRDSLLQVKWDEKVWLGFTYKQIKEKELALGLDLQGGMQVTLEISPVEIIKALSNDTREEKFLKALEMARIAQATSRESFVDLFVKSYKSQNPTTSLVSIFNNSITRKRLSDNPSESNVLSLIQRELDDAIDRSYKILQSRIDKFGVANPNIQRIAGTSRIMIELPGIDNPERARKLISGTARLEFWEVFEMNDQAINGGMEAMIKYVGTLEDKEKGAPLKDNTKKENSGLVAKNDSLKDNLVASDDSLGKPKTPANKKKDDSLEKIKKDQQIKKDTTKKAGALFAKLFTPTQSGLSVNVKDTSKVMAIFMTNTVKSAFPATVHFAWENKPSVDGKVLLFLLKKSAGGKPILEGDVVDNAREDYEQGKSAVSVNMLMNVDGAKKWRKITRDNINKRIAIVMDNAVYSAPTVQGEIPTGNSSISGNFTIEEGKDLANILKSGKMPAPTRIVEEAVVGPSLGAESVQQGVISTLFGLVVVFSFMLVYYSLAGGFANIALIFNVFFTMGVLVQFHSVLTLSGIAGIVLSVGMSVDANVLIYERIREELKQGIAIRDAIKIGFEKAYSSILDSNITTFLVGAILFTMGSGAVLGFATTLMIGIVCSLFCAVFITRLVVEWWLSNGKRDLTVKSMFFNNTFARTDYNFIQIRKTAYAISAVIIVIGGILLVIQGGFTLGVDFKGGRSYIVEFNQTIPVNDIRNEVSKEFKSGIEVKTFGKSNQVKIVTTYLTNDGSEVADKKVTEKLNTSLAKFASQKPTIKSSAKVESTIATDLLYKSGVAVLLSLIVMFIYILVRFNNWRYSLGATISLFHNVLIVLAFVGIAKAFGITFEIDQVFIAAILTVIGYSINDTVVVFDRIREFGDIRKDDFGKQLNIAINDTLSRTIVTGTTTILNVLILLIFAGEIMRGFSYALLVGIVFGTYSSIFVASPIVLDLAGRAKPKETSEAETQPEMLKL